ncbi:MAG: response regulator [Nitrospina sp.]|jgi:two-component system, chemotaxis family, chemotaxis protein CheY|nr:response regulator [Nitrospina sp.]
MVDKTLKILFVEDSEVQQELGLYRLQDLGFSNVAGASNGLDAITYLENNPVDLIISDWEMPEMDGIDLLRVVRSTPDFQKIPFVVMSVNDNPKRISTAKKEGVMDFLLKPATNKTLLETIEKIFN